MQNDWWLQPIAVLATPSSVWYMLQELNQFNHKTPSWWPRHEMISVTWHLLLVICRPVACGGPGGPGPPAFCLAPLAFRLRRAFVHAWPPPWIRRATAAKLSRYGAGDMKRTTRGVSRTGLLSMPEHIGDQEITNWAVKFHVYSLPFIARYIKNTLLASNTQTL